MESLSERICFNLAKSKVLKRQEGNAGERSATYDQGAYGDWRKEELQNQYLDHFSFDDIRGKDVVDFGCGGGELAILVGENGAKSVLGLGVDRHQFSLASGRAERGETPSNVEFRLSESTTSIDLPDESADVILCFDVLEHILDYREILPEWRRVLRPGGRVLIWWMPYYHPWGHHVESLVPLPWAHVVFPEKAVLSTCARIYDMPEFKPRIWDLDDAGNKKPNKWLGMEELPTLNKLTIAGFEKLCRETGFGFARREMVPISSSGPARTVSSALIRLPKMREFFPSVAIYALQK